MILSPTEYYKAYPNTSSNITDELEDNEELSEIKTGYLKWTPSEACNWAGAYEGDFCYFSIAIHKNLSSSAEVDVEQFNYEKYSIRNWPYGILKKYFDGNLLLNDGNSFKEYVGDKLCSRCELDQDEYNTLVYECTRMEYVHYNEQLLAKSKLPKWSSETTTVENPVVLYLCGTDDTSYSIFTPTIETALEKLALLEENPTFETLHSLGGVFTN